VYVYSLTSDFADTRTRTAVMTLQHNAMFLTSVVVAIYTGYSHISTD